MPYSAPSVCPHCRQAHRPHCQPQKTHKRLYGLKAWRRLRSLVLADQPLCLDCLASGRTTVASELHHKTAHRGNHALFFDQSNLMPLCGPCHAVRTARGE